MPHYYVNGLMVDEHGTLQVGHPPIHHFAGGLPFDSEGRLIIQLNQATVPSDPYVGGVRVGPAGGVYALDLTPPFEIDAFSDGFDEGFQ